MKNKKILVTGSSGFIGSHVADQLEQNGLNVVLFDSVKSKYKSNSQKEIIGNILNLDDVTHAINGCDAVYHFAAQADINYSSKNPTETIKSNILGTQNLLEAMRKKKIPRILFASTIYVYSELGSFYRVSKQACEKIIEEYHNEFNIDYSILRYGSLYGPRANRFNAISDFINQALKNKRIIRYGDGEEIREYIHVIDAAKLSVEALSKKYINEHLIITGNQKIKVKELLRMIKEIFSNEIEIEFGVEDILHHYEITPYNYKPKIAKKLSPKEYYDLGQGIMDLIYDMDKKTKKVIGESKLGGLKNKK